MIRGKREIQELEKLWIEINENKDIFHDDDLDEDAKMVIQLSSGRTVYVTLGDFYQMILSRRQRVPNGEINE